MKLKTLSIVIGFLAVLSIIAHFATKPTATTNTDPRVGGAILAPTDIEKTCSLRLSDQGKTLVLTRQKDGSWQVPAYYDFPADFAKIARFVEELQNAKVDRFVSANPERLARFEFKDTRIVLLDASDKELWSLTLGKNSENGSRLIRFSNEPKAYASRLSTYLDLEARNWADTGLSSFKPEDIARVELPVDGPSSLIALRARKGDPFSAEKPPAGKQLKVERLNGLLQALSGIRFSDTTALDHPGALESKQHLRTVKLTTFDGKTLSIALGRTPEKKVAAEPTEAPKTPGKPGEPMKPAEPTTKVIPPGPVYAFITHSDPGAPINTLMHKRAFQIAESTWNSLPKTADELLDPVPVQK